MILPLDTASKSQLSDRKVNLICTFDKTRSKIPDSFRKRGENVKFSPNINIVTFHEQYIFYVGGYNGFSLNEHCIRNSKQLILKSII